MLSRYQSSRRPHIICCALPLPRYRSHHLVQLISLGLAREEQPRQRRTWGSIQNARWLSAASEADRGEDCACVDSLSFVICFGTSLDCRAPAACPPLTTSTCFPWKIGGASRGSPSRVRAAAMVDGESRTINRPWMRINRSLWCAVAASR